jgi:ATP-dependent DNA helicase RecG
MLLSDEELLNKIKLGEDTFTQLKAKFNNDIQLAEELVAFANTKGGYILVGVSDTGKIVDDLDIRTHNQHISNASSEHCVPPIYPQTEIKTIEGKRILVIQVSEGTQKPYRTKQGKYLMKSGSDKRAISQEELGRMILSGAYHIEELPIRESNIETDLEKSFFYFFFEKEFKISLIEHLQNQNQTLEQVLNNMNLAKNQELTLTGLMIFGKFPQKFRPVFLIKAVSFYGNQIEDSKYLSSDDITGNLETQFRRAFDFIKSNLLKVQQTATFNSIGTLEISEIALEEHLVNALIHRDYTKLSSINVLIFQDRVEIISPGKLPNHLSVENIKNGNAIARNPILTSFASRTLPYRGLGSGIRRALNEHANTDLINDVEGEQFKVILYRKRQDKI